MKKYIICSLFLSMTLASCDDFFSPETEDALSSDDYLSSLTQMANGYLGVLTSMQTVGDKEIYLTDTRGDMLEPTEQCIAPLIALYNYVDDLSGNAYADPAGYYDVIIACNDYLYKMQEFRAKYPELVDETDYFPGLYASAIRVKAWAYMTLAEIYGQALWFDDPIHASKDANDTSVFTMMQTQEIVQKCISMLNTDVTLDSKMTISPKEKFSWISWVDVEHVTAVAQSSYRYWDMMTPDFEPLMGKLQLWNAACLQRDGHIAEANAAYEAVLDNLLPYLQKYWAQYSHYWKRCPTTPGHLSAFWNNATPYQEEVVSAIIYDYTKNQTNKLLYHFSNEYPNKYLLRSNEACRERYTDPTFNPSMGEGDKRLGLTTKEVNGQWCISKYRPNANVRANAYQDDVHIYTFRCSELFLWIAEALNHLGRYEAMNRVINTGFAATDYDMLMHLQNEEWDEVSEANQKEFKGFDSYWAIPSSVDKYGTYTGFRGCLDNLLPVDVWTEVGHTAEEAQRHNDDLLVKEWTLEFPAEGKTYPNLIRFAERYNDPAIVSDIVTLKYGDKASTIAAKIQGTNLNGTKGYYVPWKLK